MNQGLFANMGKCRDARERGSFGIEGAEGSDRSLLSPFFPVAVALFFLSLSFSSLPLAFSLSGFRFLSSVGFGALPSFRFVFRSHPPSLVSPFRSDP